MTIVTIPENGILYITHTKKYLYALTECRGGSVGRKGISLYTRLEIRTEDGSNLMYGAECQGYEKTSELIFIEVPDIIRRAL